MTPAETMREMLVLETGIAERKALLEVMKAFVEGKEIQCRLKTDTLCKWQFVGDPVWNHAEFEYRVKPVRRYITVWLPKGQTNHALIRTTRPMMCHRHLYEEKKCLVLDEDDDQPKS